VGKVLYETSGWLSHPRVSPDGERVCFAEHRFRGDTAGDLVVVDRKGKATTLVRNLTLLDGLSWISGGREILWSGARSGNSASLWAVDLSGRERFIHRSGITEYAHDASAAGAALVIQSTARRETYLSGSAAGGSRDRDLSWLDWTFPDAISADGSRILSTEQGDASREEYLVYLRKTDGSAAVQLGPGNALAMSPDGGLVAANRRGRAGGRRSLVLYPTGAGQPRTIDMPNLDPLSAAFFPDGRRLVVCADAPGRPAGLYEVSLEGRPVRPIAAPLMNPFFFFVSPDAESVAGVTGEGRIIVVPVRGGEPRLYPADLGAASVVGWSADGRSCYYIDRGTISVRIHRLELATGGHELVREIAVQDPAGVQQIGPLFVTPDGRSAVYSYRRFLSDLVLVEGLR
jgi:Tol biopolymer transport system component